MVKDIEKVNWPDLNRLLLETEDEELLKQWLDETLTGERKSKKYRALRIHGRLNAVRRARELREIEAAA